MRAKYTVGFWGLSFLLLLLLGCSGGSGEGVREDSDTGDGAGSSDDSGVTEDSGSSDDSGDIEDSGNSDDSGVTEDSGSSDDSGDIEDSGSSDDSGDTEDSGSDEATDTEEDLGTDCIMTGATPSLDWTFEVGQRMAVPNEANVPVYIWKWQPDGHIATLPDGEGGYMMYWALSTSWRTVGTTAFPEDMTHLDPVDGVFGGQSDEPAWDSGGSWLMSVLRVRDKELLGFYHAEDHFDPPSNPSNIAWKSIGVTQSTDNGRSWRTGTPIITANEPKPITPTWGGAGDNSAVWDCQNRRFVIYYSEKTDDFRISAAATSDETGLTGWKKWNGSDFDSPGIGGESSPLVGLWDQPGANPSVQWNTHLEKWVIVWHGWDGNIYISSSTNGIEWDRPQFVAGPGENRVRAWYPTLIDKEGGDTVGGQVVRLYYADISADVSQRVFVYKTITFRRND